MLSFWTWRLLLSYLPFISRSNALLLIFSYIVVSRNFERVQAHYVALRLWLPRAISVNNRGGFGVLGRKNRGLTGVKTGD